MELTTPHPSGDATLAVQALSGEWYPACAVRDRVTEANYATSVYVHHAQGTTPFTAAQIGELAAQGRVAPVGLVDLAPAPVFEVASGPEVRYVAGAPRHPAFALRVETEGEAPSRTTARAFLADNEDGLEDEEVAAVLALQPGQRMTLGGGAAPAFTVSRPARKTGHRGLFGLMHVRCAQWERHTGELAEAIRERAVLDATDGATGSARGFDDGRHGGLLEHVVSFIEHELHGAGFDLDAADAAYRARDEAKREGVTDYV